MRKDVHDVVIIGGGPAGATLGAVLARETDLDVAILEREVFPREHIGESFAHGVIPCIQESGALSKVMASECYVKKHGGFYSWDPRSPSVALFAQSAWAKDGHLRWSIHCNRPEFDQILLSHARDSGVSVREGVEVTRVSRDDGVTHLSLSTGETLSCRLLVDASGRSHALLNDGGKTWLSKYRNVAFWTHVVGGRPTQSLPYEWNVFRKMGDLSSIGSFMFEDGWFWYIPVPRIINGQRTLTHSLGMVTDPRVLRLSGKQYNEIGGLVAKAKAVPLLRELLVEAEPISDVVHTATNYSMISRKMCDFDEQWIRVGDAAYFVDPLFSSGVTFAMQHALAAARIIRTTFDASVPRAQARELWMDYDEKLRHIAHSFAVTIDQWYAAIAKENPDSVYWNERSSDLTFDTRQETFHALVNTSIFGDLIQTVTKGTNSLEALGQDGALAKTIQLLKGREPSPDSRVALRPGVGIKESLTLEQISFIDPFTQRRIRVEGEAQAQLPRAERHGPYWQDPEKLAGEVSPTFPEPVPCHRIYFEDQRSTDQVKFVDALHGGRAMIQLFSSGPHRYEDLKAALTPPQHHLLLHLILLDMVSVEC